MGSISKLHFLKERLRSSWGFLESFWEGEGKGKEEEEEKGKIEEKKEGEGEEEAEGKEKEEDALQPPPLLDLIHIYLMRKLFNDERTEGGLETSHVRR